MRDKSGNPVLAIEKQSIVSLCGWPEQIRADSPTHRGTLKKI